MSLIPSTRYPVPSTHLPTCWLLVLVLLVATPLVAVMVRGGVPLPIDLIARHSPHRAAASSVGLSVESAPISHELATLLLPQRVLVREALLAGRWPHWNPSVHGGMPLAGASQAAPLWPTSLILTPLPLPLALGLDCLLRLLVAAVGAFFLARDLGSRPPAAVAAGLAFGLGGFTVFFAMWPLGAAMATLPWVWLLVRRLVRRPGHGEIVALAVALAALVCAGHPESTLHVVSVGVVVGLVGLAQQRGARARMQAVGGAAGLLGCALAAPFLLPTLELLPMSAAWHHRGGDLAPASSAAEALDFGIGLIVPFRSGPVGGVVLDPWSSWHLPWATASIGGGLLILVGVGLLQPGRIRLALLAATVVGLMAGARVAPLWPLLERVVLFDRAVNDRLVVLGLLGLALLAARGADRLLEATTLLRVERWLAPGVVAILVVATVLSSRGALLRPEVRGSTALLVAATLVVSAALAADLRGRPALLLLLVVVAAERWATSWQWVEGRDPRFLGLDVPLLEQARLEVGEAPARVVGVGRQLTPNLGALAGLEDLRGYDPVVLDRLEAVRTWSTRLPSWYDRVDDLGQPAIDRLGVRLALAPAGFPLAEGWREIGAEGSVQLAENTAALGRAFVPRRVRINGPPALDDGSGTVASVAIDGVGPSEIDNPEGEVLVRRRAPNRLELDLSMEAEGWVVVTEPAWPGWRAMTAAGEPREVAIADHAFLALRAPAGRHEITLEWRPRTFALGAWLSAAGVVVLMALVATRRQPLHGTQPLTPNP